MTKDPVAKSDQHIENDFGSERGRTMQRLRGAYDPIKLRAS